VKSKFYLAVRTSCVTRGDSFRKQIGHSFHHDDHLLVYSRCLVVRLDLVDSLHRSYTTEVCTDPAQAAEVMVKKLSQFPNSHSDIYSLPCLLGLAHLLHGSQLENNEISRFALKNCYHPNEETTLAGILSQHTRRYKLQYHKTVARFESILRAIDLEKCKIKNRKTLPPTKG
jgi:hypothetical protein